MKFLSVLISALTLTTVSSWNLPRNEVVPESRIYNGKKAKNGQFPYIVGISSQLTNGKSFWCGGSIISKQYVLTAAHCTRDAVGSTIYYGITFRLIAELSHIVSKKSYIIHPAYNRANDMNDVCLIKTKPVTFTPTIQAIKLAPKGTTYVNKKAVAAGWGSTNSAKIGLVDDLYFVSMEVIENDKCMETYGDKITSSNLCTKTKGIGSICQGDSGGPLLFNKVLIGVASLTSSKGCDAGSPAIFARVSSYLEWISDYVDI